jgi:alpha-amylase/alpha-mannosidase (GH57 family)
MDRNICIHGHFYQPPRENPWLEEVEFQDSAYPYHDWNERITAECYAPNAASRILDTEKRIIEITNTFTQISFNFGPTLLSWMKRQKPDVYQAILEADRLSIERFSGHGSAIAQAYNHMIMPLANRRDKYTQIIWGIKDFQKRFNRFPEGMWLPEMAVDTETLEMLVNLGIKYTILSPRQAKRINKIGEDGKWQDVSGEKIDPTMAYLCILPSGQSINLFFYDGPISRDVSFGGLLNNGEAFAKRLLSAALFSEHRHWSQIVNIVTDGETFGHHHRHGDMALSYCLLYIKANNLAKITNYGEYLEKHPPTHVVEFFENSSWSCAHGVERWRDDCGCNSGNHPGWTQAWRKSLRNAMDWLRDKIIPIYRNEASKYLNDPWDARNDYIKVILDRSRENVEEFLRKHAIKELSKKEKIRVLKLLEIQRNAMLMYTSCGWFFDDISGIETIQVMQYAAKAIQHIEELQGLSLDSEYLKYLEKSPGNIYENAKKIYDMFVKPARSNLLRVGAHYSISSIFEKCPEEEIKTFHYTAKSGLCGKMKAGKLTLTLGKVNITSEITWEEQTISFAVLHLGDHNINGGVKEFAGDEEFLVMQDEIKNAFEKGDVPEVIRLMDKHFGSNIYSIWHLFKDEQRKVLDQILRSRYEEIETSYRQMYENNYAIMNFFHSLHIPLPRPFSAAAEYVLNTDLKQIFEEVDLDIEKLKKLIDETRRWSVKIDTTTIGFVAGSWLNSLMEKLYQQPEDLRLFERIDSTLEVLRPLSLSLDFWKAQNKYFLIGKNLYKKMEEKAAKGDNFPSRWIDVFNKLGRHLHVKV